MVNIPIHIVHITRRTSACVEGCRWRLQLVMLFVSTRAAAAGAATANILGHEES